MANDKVEKQLTELKALRSQGLTPETAAQLKKSLADKVSLVVAKAAQICGELNAVALLPDLKHAFEKMFEAKDQQCWAKNALAKTLKDLGLQESAVFLRGISHVQMEPVWGGSEDTAATLRSTCAIGLTQCNDIQRDEILRYLVDSLTDTIASVRMDAARSLEQMSGREVLLLLRLKARVGDMDPRVTGEVLEALLQMEGPAALSFVSEFLDNSDQELSDEAALAMGASKLPEALPLLKQAWETRPSPVVLRAISVLRLSEALDFLIDLLKEGRPRDAEEALHALELQKASEEVVKRVEEAVSERADVKLYSIFRQRFQRE
jgi:HEAT repeat protein